MGRLINAPMDVCVGRLLTCDVGVAVVGPTVEVVPAPESLLVTATDPDVDVAAATVVTAAVVVSATAPSPRVSSKSIEGCLVFKCLRMLEVLPPRVDIKFLQI